MIPSVSCETKETLFDISVIRASFNGIDNVEIVRQVLEHHKRLSDDPNSCLYEDTFFNPGSGTAGHELMIMLRRHFLDNGFDIVEFWSQIHRPLESTNTHHHGQHEMAFVYYVSVPKGAGDIVFEIEHLIRPIHPKEGELLVFPGWLKHRVSKNMSDSIRISISGNLRRI